MSTATVRPATVVFAGYKHFDVEGCADVWEALVLLNDIREDAVPTSEVMDLLGLTQETIYRRLQLLYARGHVDSRLDGSRKIHWTAVPLNRRRATG